MGNLCILCEEHAASIFGIDADSPDSGLCAYCFEEIMHITDAIIDLIRGFIPNAQQIERMRSAHTN